MSRKFLAVFFSFILLIPFAHAADLVEMRGTVTIRRGDVNANITVPLNLSNPEELKKYSPVYNFWPNNTTSGILIDSTLPPDILQLNDSQVTLNGTFTLSSHLCADGASVLMFRLPITADVDNITDIELKIYQGGRTVVDYYFDWALLRSYAEPLSKYNVSYYNITYLNLSLSLIYITLHTMIFSDELYNYTLTVYGLKDAYLLVAPFDLFADNATGYTLNGQKQNGDLMCGFKVLDMISNGLGEFYIPFAQKTFTLNKTYTGRYYISFALGLISFSANQNITIRMESLNSVGAVYYVNSTYVLVNRTGTLMLYGHVGMNMSDTSKIKITVYSNVSNGVMLITEGADNTPIMPDNALITKSIVEIQKTYLKLYMDVVVSSSAYYFPYFVKLPSTWQGNIVLVLWELGASAYIPVVLTGLYMGINAIKLTNFTLNVLFTPYRIAKAYLENLINNAFAAFMWFFTIIIDFFLDAVEFWLWVVALLVTVVFNALMWLIAAVLINAFVNAFVRLPKEGIGAVFDEFSRGLSIVNQIIGLAIRRIKGVIK